jgi:hypothetical protein
MRTGLLFAAAACAALAAPAQAQDSAGRSRALESYARAFGTTAEEAERRRHLRWQIVGLRQALERGEPDSFAGLSIEHVPEYRVVVKFTRNPAATLRRYTRDPLFVAEPARIPMGELLAAQTPVYHLLKSHGIRSVSAPDFDRNDLQVAVQDLPLAQRLRASGALKLPLFVRLVQGHWPADHVDPPGY